MDLFKKSVVVGVSITPSVGLEVAQIDYQEHKLLKYTARPLNYNAAQQQVEDLDILKSTLQDALDELEIPKGAVIVFNMPNVYTRVVDYPASMEPAEIGFAIEDELAEHYLFKDTDACYAFSILPSVSMQFNKVAYTAANRSTIIELVLFIKELGYSVGAINTSINTTLNSLMYLGRVNTDADINWMLVIVDNNSVVMASMLGNSYMDIYEERIGIGQVLDESENYSTVINAISPILKNIPSKYIYIVSKTDVISAEALANKMSCSAPITYQESNSYLKEQLLETDSEFLETAKPSLDVIGAAIDTEFAPLSVARLSLYNRTLGDVFLADQPIEITILNKTIPLTEKNLAIMFIAIAVITFITFIIFISLIMPAINKQKRDLRELDSQISKINEFLQENKDISAEMFDEGIEIKTGVTKNKTIYSYYTIVGTEIPKKLWLTHLKLSDKVTIEGQADNLESVYSFFRNIKDYAPEANVKLQKLGLATKASASNTDFDTESMLSAANADFYEFRISNEEEIKASDINKDDKKSDSKNNESSSNLPDLEPIKE